VHLERRERLVRDRDVVADLGLGADLELHELAGAYARRGLDLLAQHRLVAGRQLGRGDRLGTGRGLAARGGGRCRGLGRIGDRWLSGRGRGGGDWRSRLLLSGLCPSRHWLQERKTEQDEQGSTANVVRASDHP
jgi:hypothetical protein